MTSVDLLGNALGLPLTALSNKCVDLYLGAVSACTLLLSSIIQCFQNKDLNMCRKVACSSCGKPSWAGCGMHVDSVSLPLQSTCWQAADAFIFKGVDQLLTWACCKHPAVP